MSSCFTFTLFFYFLLGHWEFVGRGCPSPASPPLPLLLRPWFPDSARGTCSDNMMQCTCIAHVWCPKDFYSCFSSSINSLPPLGHCFQLFLRNLNGVFLICMLMCTICTIFLLFCHYLFPITDQFPGAMRMPNYYASKISKYIKMRFKHLPSVLQWTIFLHKWWPLNLCGIKQNGSLFPVWYNLHIVLRYTERQKKLITSSERHTLKFKALNES